MDKSTIFNGKSTISMIFYGHCYGKIHHFNPFYSWVNLKYFDWAMASIAILP